MRIGSVARLTGIPGRRIRFYEERGLISPAARSEAGYRLYGEREVARLEFIKQAKTLGLTLREIAELVSVADGCSRNEIAHHLEAVLEEKLKRTRERIEELVALERNLHRFLGRAEALERGDLPTPCDSDEPTEFCGCLEAVTGEEVDVKTAEEQQTPCACDCGCCDIEQCYGCCEKCA